MIAVAHSMHHPVSLFKRCPGDGTHAIPLTWNLWIVPSSMHSAVIPLQAPFLSIIRSMAKYSTATHGTYKTQHLSLVFFLASAIVPTMVTRVECPSSHAHEKVLDWRKTKMSMCCHAYGDIVTTRIDSSQIILPRLATSLPSHDEPVNIQSTHGETDWLFLHGRIPKQLHKHLPKNWMLCFMACPYSVCNMACPVRSAAHAQR